MGNNYCVYEHKFPNGKRYIGITKTSIKNRWRNGEGYNKQPKVYSAIKKYGWENIEHKIIISDITREQAQGLEKYLIQSLNTIENGYNISIGGDIAKGTYLNDYMKDMCKYIHKYNADDILVKWAETVYNDRKDLERAEFWNAATKAVISKHREFSPTDLLDVCEFWFYISQFCELHTKIQIGEDVSNWREKIFGEDIEL